MNLTGAPLGFPPRRRLTLRESERDWGGLKSGGMVCRVPVCQLNRHGRSANSASGGGVNSGTRKLAEKAVYYVGRRLLLSLLALFVTAVTGSIDFLPETSF